MTNAVVPHTTITDADSLIKPPATKAELLLAMATVRAEELVSDISSKRKAVEDAEQCLTVAVNRIPLVRRAIKEGFGAVNHVRLDSDHHLHVYIVRPEGGGVDYMFPAGSPHTKVVRTQVDALASAMEAREKVEGKAREYIRTYCSKSYWSIPSDEAALKQLFLSAAKRELAGKCVGKSERRLSLLLTGEARQVIQAALARALKS